MRGRRDLAHGRLKRGHERGPTAVIVPGFQRQAHRQDEVGQLGCLVEEIAQADDEQVRGFKGGLGAAFRRQAEHGIGVVQDQEIGFPCGQGLEHLEHLCAAGGGLHAVAVGRVDEAQLRVEQEVQQVGREVGDKAVGIRLPGAGAQHQRPAGLREPNHQLLILR